MTKSWTGKSKFNERPPAQAANCLIQRGGRQSRPDLQLPGRRLAQARPAAACAPGLVDDISSGLLPRFSNAHYLIHHRLKDARTRDGMVANY
ncbi:hypothetical protein EVAR_103074_1 [Eumeta japonica]|uniref:Uncharacterized protein n=1 Tax=Eumeta variegata TaxID=151549 RepID=A0A4C1WQM6_EUMVA|nr:hypothetical protein EVAR_103074_1 [Eumeta japonica]